MKTAVREGIEAFWHKEHPGEPVTEPVREQIAAAAETAVVGIGRVGVMRIGNDPLVAHPTTPHARREAGTAVIA